MSARSWTDAKFRAGAGAFEMDNEASVVHCFDEASRKDLKKTQLGKEQDSVSARTLANLAKKRLFAEFSVPRDSPTFGFVAVGEPPSASEIGAGTWREPQTAELSLPSGLLRMETALSFSLWPEIPQEDGVFVEVPPGDYRLTFVVAEFAEPDQPRILLTLTPLAGSLGPVEVKTRPAPPPLPKNSKLGQYTVENGCFEGWRQQQGTNLDRRAAGKLGLKFGEKLRFNGKSGQVDAWYLGEFGAQPCLEYADFLAVSHSASGYRSDLFCCWRSFPEADKWKVMNVARFVDAVNYPEPLPHPTFQFEQHKRIQEGLPPLEPPKLSAEERVRLADSSPILDQYVIEKPEKVTVSVLPDRLRFEAAALDDWSLDQGVISARVLTWSPKVVTLNIGPRELQRLGSPNNEFEMEIAGDVRRLVLLPRNERERPSAVSTNYRCHFHNAHDQFPEWLLLMKSSRNLPDDLVSPFNSESQIIVDAPRFVEWNEGELVKRAARFGKLIREAAERGERLIVEPKPIATPPILCATGIPYWADSSREVVWIESGAYRRDYSVKVMWDEVLPHALPAPAGISVKLKCQS